jgi:hypothetical protein
MCDLALGVSYLNIAHHVIIMTICAKSLENNPFSSLKVKKPAGKCGLYHLYFEYDIDLGGSDLDVVILKPLNYQYVIEQT